MKKAPPEGYATSLSNSCASDTIEPEMQTQSKRDTVQVRRNKDHYVMPATLIFFLLLAYVFLWTKPPQERWRFEVPFFLYLFGTALFLFLKTHRSTVIADATGLRWRFLGRWQSALWEDVEDYFFLLPAHNRTNCIRFRDGRLLELPVAFWGDQTALVAIIAQNATSAKPSGWLLRGREGTITGSRVFSFKGKRRPEYFETDEQGVGYFDGHTHHHAVWSEVLGLHDPRENFGRGVCTLDTETWSASAHLTDRELFKATVRQYAPQASCGRVRTPQNELLIPTERSEGKRTCHYQTRANRRTLAGSLCFVSIYLLLPVSSLLVRDRFVSVGSAICFLFGIVGLLAWGRALWQYKTEKIIIDQESVIWQCRGKQTRVFFEEIKEISTFVSSDSLTTHNGERPISWRHSLANVAELRAEIEKHLQTKS